MKNETQKKRNEYLLKKNRKILLKSNYTNNNNQFKCEYCGFYPLFKGTANVMKFNTVTIDHIISLSDGGTNELDNLKVCCYECNNRKNVYRGCFRKGNLKKQLYNKTTSSLL